MAGSEVFIGSRAIREVGDALTDNSIFGVPRYTTALLPPVTGNRGGLVFDTTTTSLKVCDGASWVGVGGGAATSVTPGTTTVTGATNAVLYADATGVLRASSVELGFNDSTNQLLLQDGTLSAPSLAFASDSDTGIRLPFPGIVSIVSGGSSVAQFGDDITLAALDEISLSSSGATSITADSITLSPLTNVVEQRRAGIAQTLRVYGTFTNTSNYERVSLSHDGSGDAFLTAETAGTGADAQNITVAGAGDGSVILAASPSTGVQVRNGSNAIPIHAYATFTDASNFERLSIIPSLGGGAVISVNSAGTGADNLGLTLQAAGTGAVNISSGQFLNLIGSAAAPAYSFTDDPNTGIYRSGADLLILATGGGAQFGVQNSSNVQVSTTGSYGFTTDVATGAGNSTSLRQAAAGVVAYGAPGASPTVASAANITVTSNIVHVSGTTTITSITNGAGYAGARITLIFDGVLTVTDGSNLKLALSFATAADSTLTLVSDGTNWYEVARSTN